MDDEREYIFPFKIKLPKVSTPIKITYTDEELQRLLKKPKIKNVKFTEYRNWVIVNYCLSSGNRLRTVCNILTDDVDIKNCCILLRAMKNGEQQILPLSQTICTILEEYISIRNSMFDGDYLFCTSRGQKIGARGMQSAIANFNKMRGVNKTSLHLFRHRFAKDWAAHGGSVFKLQKLLNHKSLEMSRRYCNLYSNDLRDDYNKYNSLELQSKKKH